MAPSRAEQPHEHGVGNPTRRRSAVKMRTAVFISSVGSLKDLAKPHASRMCQGIRGGWDEVKAWQVCGAAMREPPLHTVRGLPSRLRIEGLNAWIGGVPVRAAAREHGHLRLQPIRVVQ